jgi:AraC-like DNA-binding protein
VVGRRIAREAGIEPAALEDPDARVSREALTRLWELAVAATGDEAFGLTAARYATQTTFHALGYAVLASSTLKEAFERIIRYRRLIGDVIELELVAENDRYRFVVDVSAPPGAPDQAVDATMAVCVRQARMLTGDRDFAPLAVMLERAEPEDATAFRQVFRAPVSFSEDSNVLEFSREDFEKRLPTGNGELARQNDHVVLGYLARLEKASLVTRVKKALLDALPNGAPSRRAVARSLGMSERSMQRHLAAEGVSYKALLDDARMSLARDYVREGRLSVTEIAFVLGFADTSTFSRAFKRWTGMGPTAFRAAGGLPPNSGE